MSNQFHHSHNSVIPYQPTSVNVQNTQVHMVNTAPVVVQPGYQEVNATSYIVLACLVFWCCNWPMGLIAFICAMLASSAASEGDMDKARTCGNTSVGFSVAGVIMTVVLIILYVVVF